MGTKFKRLQVHAGVFPDLVIDEALEHEREETFERTPFRGCRFCMGGAVEQGIGHGGLAGGFVAGEAIGLGSYLGRKASRSKASSRT